MVAGAKLGTPADRRRRRGEALLSVVFRAYKQFLSPALHSLSFARGGCGFQPTCSEFATLALAEHGLLRGGAMSLWRVLRCNPFHCGGWDPVKPGRSSSRNTGM